MTNGLQCYVTSLASRRASHYNCHHIHRIFCINPSKKADPNTAAERALKKMHYHPEKKALLMSLNKLVIEEIGLPSSELLATMDLILQSVRQNQLFFGGIFVIANGDTNHSPNIDGSDIFLSTTLLFTFETHFLVTLVRMLDPIGERLLELMTQRPMPEVDVNSIVRNIRENCTFLPNWDSVNDSSIMKVFGRREAEREAMIRHQTFISSSGQPFYEFIADDEVCNSASNNWISANDDVSKFLNSECREPQKVIVKVESVVRLTINTENCSQGQICIVGELPSNGNSSLLLYIAPEIDSIATPNLFTQKHYLSWRSIRLRKVTGFVHKWGKSSVRRTQVPVTNYVALTVHKLMGDTFAKIATQLSVREKKYSLWLPSQLYVIVSRVCDLKNLVFIGDQLVFFCFPSFPLRVFSSTILTRFTSFSIFSVFFHLRVFSSTKYDPFHLI